MFKRSNVGKIKKNYLCRDIIYKENHSAEKSDKNSCPFKSYVNLFNAKGFFGT